jgi:oxygen-independent coproporphyrinogen-3 oxidase
MAGIYIHIPICATRCIYCDFFPYGCKPEVAFREAGAGAGDAPRLFARGEIRPLFRGGTPRTAAADFAHIFRYDRAIYDVSDCEEITLKQIGHMRQSSSVAPQSAVHTDQHGVQSFDATDLHFQNSGILASRHYSGVALPENGIRISASTDLWLPGRTVAGWTHN